MCHLVLLIQSEDDEFVLLGLVDWLLLILLLELDLLLRSVFDIGFSRLGVSQGRGGAGAILLCFSRVSWGNWRLLLLSLLLRHHRVDQWQAMLLLIVLWVLLLVILLLHLRLLQDILLLHLAVHRHDQIIVLFFESKFWKL